MNTVIIPCHRRPAFLAATLRLVEKARGSGRNHYMFSIDRGAHSEIENVIRGFKHISASSIVKRKHKYVGNSFNVLEALKSVSTNLEPRDLVYLLEDDVFVAEDFFEFHQDAHKLGGDPFFVTACRVPRVTEAITRRGKLDVEEVFRTRQYQPLGVSFRAYQLGVIVEHACREYYRDMIGYCSAVLPDTFPVTEVEQASLIARIMRRDDGWGFAPVVPRAFHAGYDGYNRGGLKSEIPNWRTESERLLTLQDDQMNRMADPRFRDIESCELIRSRVGLRVV